MPVGKTEAINGESGQVKEDSSHRWLVWTVVVAVALAVGVGAYLIGRSTGEDLDAAKAAGAAAGRRVGIARGTHRGYADGFKRGRNEGYAETYPDAYARAYRQAFKDVDLSPPKDVPVPKNSP